MPWARADPRRTLGSYGVVGLEHLVVALERQPRAAAPGAAPTAQELRRAGAEGLGRGEVLDGEAELGAVGGDDGGDGAEDAERQRTLEEEPEAAIGAGLRASALNPFPW